MRKMAKASKNVAQGSVSPALTKRYGSIAEIKRDLFPVAAAEETAAISGRHEGGYEKLMNEFFGPQQQPSS
jgi:hypothetical protein